MSEITKCPAIDCNHGLFCSTNDYVEFVECDDIVDRARTLAAATPCIEPSSGGNFFIRPPLYYSLANGINDNRAINDALCSVAQAWQCRFMGVAEPKFGQAAENELRRLAELGAVGVMWSPRAQGIFADDQHLADLCALADDVDLLSAILCAPYSINESLMRIWHTARHCANIPLLILGAFGSLENIYLIQREGGGPVNTLYDISNLAAPRDLIGVTKAIGSGRLLFGSGDARFHKASLQMLLTSDLDETDKQAIAFGNAQRLMSARDRTR